MDQSKAKSKIKTTIKIISVIFLVLYVSWSEYRNAQFSKRLEVLKKENETYADQFDELKGISATSTESLNNLYTTLSNVIQEESLKSKNLEEKVTSLDKLSKSDPQMLKKYSKVYFLNENYTPAKTETIPIDYTLNKKNEYKIHADVLPFLQTMIDDARKEGLNPIVISAYRSFQTQTLLKAQNKVTYGASTANRFVAEQGFSEHQLGTTVDFTILEISDTSLRFDSAKEYEWLQKNAHRYGFILSYPRGNTYYAYEPWHWRFVGKSLATQLYQDNINFYNLDQRSIDGYLLQIFDK